MSNKALYLHIGTNKTGTTTIQEYLFSRRNDLLSCGILYPASGCSRYGNHSHLARSLLRSAAYSRPAYKWQKFLKEVKGSDASSVIVSGEVFYNLGCEHLQAMASSLESVFREIYVICYLRRQDEYLKACYTQGVKMGRVDVSLGEYQEDLIQKENLRAYRYAHQLQKWAAVFSAGAIIVRPFEKQQLYQADVLSDFCKTLSLPISLCPSGPAMALNSSPGKKSWKLCAW